MDIDFFLSKLDGVRQTGKDKYIARCPAHKDKSPSLSVLRGENGRIVLHCFASCSVQDIVNALGLRVSDLFREGLEKTDKIYISANRVDEIVLRCWYCAIFLNDVKAGKLIKEKEAHKFNAYWRKLIYHDLPILKQNNKMDLQKKIEALIKLRASV